ncbi:hypothetical protein G0Q03_21020 [Epibacterium mobile]|nr:hypothetical protein [Tritonibacter mobilis]
MKNADISRHRGSIGLAMYDFGSRTNPPPEDSALFAWSYIVSLLAYQAAPYIFGWQTFLGWPVTDAKIWMIIGFGLATLTSLTLCVLVRIFFWIFG